MPSPTSGAIFIGTVYYLQNNLTGAQRSLRTSDPAQAQRSVDIENSATGNTGLHLELGRAYLRAARIAMVTSRSIKVKAGFTEENDEHEGNTVAPW